MQVTRIAGTFSLLSVLACSAIAETEIHHAHQGLTKLKVNYQSLDFANSKKKDDGNSYGIEIDHHKEAQHLRLYMEHTDTATTVLIPEDLKVNKLHIKYQYKLNKQSALSLSYAHIDDNIMAEVDSGRIFGVGYKYKALHFNQYFSDYKNFNVYQSDLQLGLKRNISNFKVMGAVIGKYIRLEDRESTKFTKKAEQDYFTLGLKAHAHYGSWHFGAGTYLGERLFAVMNQGMKVQHHAMEFNQSMMLSIGKDIGSTSTYLRYARHNATEVPIANENVKVETLALEFSYQF